MKWPKVKLVPDWLLIGFVALVYTFTAIVIGCTLGLLIHNG